MDIGTQSLSYRQRPCLHLALKCDLYLNVVCIRTLIRLVRKDQDMCQEGYERNWLRCQQKIRHFKTMKLNVQPCDCKDLF